MFLASNGIKWDPQRSTKKKTSRETEKRGETGNENTAKETVIKIVTKTRIKKGGEGKTEQKIEKRSHPAEDDERVEKKKAKREEYDDLYEYAVEESTRDDHSNGIVKDC